MNDRPLSLFLPDESATLALGRKFAPLITPGMTLWLRGELGAGKTALARALLRALGYAGTVKSPTYALVEVYVISSLYLYHFDFYRLNVPEEFEERGLGEYFEKEAIRLVEWPEKAAGHVPSADLEFTLRFADQAREARIRAWSERGHQCLTAFTACESAAGN
ncbi:MAG: tRNA (adenosine(37)-N6)-threonylcarbamoyltransferase complex ATPase subunit type 1 TsaE [Candidatus Accumulibacter sp.]|jgi:tRNA threonylcarbamoyladenosine biosynthesis protein TsaE|nr:tRNA (adenosine(37)-N6)-threonylcarbamoyltransferase complex ATPase subunit type 1 TsaE [Accumulibacter sp.]